VAALDAKIFAASNAFTSPRLPALLSRLLENQKRDWPVMAEGFASLAYAQLREVQCRSYSAWLQFNPKRIVSTGAKVDAESINQRRCFLCVENLAAEQHGVLYQNDFLILCNPMPIFPAHFTISHVRHLPQIIAPFLDKLLQLARDLSPDFILFYNGAQCGASAPDHFHFQAAPAGKIPIEQDAGQASRRELIKEIEGVAVILLQDLGRTVFVFEGSRAANIMNVLRRQLNKMQTVLNIAEEPKVNIICAYQAPNWRVILFPRRQHRPEIFFREGEDKVLISPASVDMGGLIVTPVKKDFNTVDANMIEAIYREVSWDEATARQMLL
jgi:hypothetical protein